jgi:hypothetical protein
MDLLVRCLRFNFTKTARVVAMRERAAARRWRASILTRVMLLLAEEIERNKED